ncbi:MAG: redoxin domain-containing protein [Anaerolineae bacterium]
MCKAMLAQLRQAYPTLQKRGIEIVAVTMAPPTQTREYSAEQDLPFVCLSDVERRSHAAYSLASSLVGTVHPATWGAYARSLLKGDVPLPAHTSDEAAQLAGVFVIDQGGIVHYAYRSRTVSDFPDSETLIAAAGDLRAAAPKAQ